MTTRGHSQRVNCPNPTCGESYEVDHPIGEGESCRKCGASITSGNCNPVQSVAATESVAAARSDTSRVLDGGQPAAPADKGVVNVSQSFGHYRIVRELGRGGMAIVYLAEDSILKRPVAIKFPFDDPRRRRELRTRFLREAQAAARVSHPNICHVYEAREIEGQPYLAMEYIDGKSLSEVTRGRPLTERQAAGLVRKIALAVAAAHDAGLVHRDLKPSNVMLTRNGEPKVTDFGLAKAVVAESSRITRSGAVLGTPAYMPREQALGEEEKIGPLSDVCSLGVILYELLCGRPPYEGPASAVLGQVIASEPPPPSTHAIGLDPRMERICLKAMAREPEDRYSSMPAFADDLGDWLQATSRSGETLVGIADAVQGRKPRRRSRGKKRQVASSRKVIWWWTGGLACLLAAAIITALSLPRDNEPEIRSDPEARAATGLQPELVGDANGSVAPDLGGGENLASTAGTPESGPAVMENPVEQPAAVAVTPIDNDAPSPDSEPAADAAHPADEPVLPKTIVVGPGDDMVHTLSEAVLTVAPGDTIEIQTDGPLEVDPTIARDLEGRFTIKAGAGFQPVLVRRPGEDGSLFHFKAANNNINASFDMEGLTFVNLTPDNQPGMGPQHHVVYLGCPFAIRRCIFISSNGAIGYSHQDVGYSETEDSGRIEDCYFVGIDLGSLSFHDMVQCGAGNVRISNNLFTSGRFPLMLGSGCGGAPEGGPRSHVTLIHNTFTNCNQFFGLFGRSSINCRDNLIAYQRAHIVTDGTGSQTFAEAREFLEYQGTHNAFYEFRWQIYSSNYRTGSDPTVWNFLTRSGETNPNVLTGASCFRQPNIASGRMPGIFSPQAYALLGDRRLIGRATDGENVGVDVARLPDLPPMAQQIVLEIIAGNRAL